MRLILLSLELGFVWLVYYLFALSTTLSLPMWLTAILVVIVDRIVTYITTMSAAQKERIEDKRTCDGT